MRHNLPMLPIGITMRAEAQHGITFYYVIGPPCSGKTTYINHCLKACRAHKIIAAKCTWDSAELSSSIADMKATGVTVCYVEALEP